MTAPPSRTSLPVRLLKAELSMYRDIWLAVNGKRDGVGPGVTGFDYGKGTLILPIAFTVAGLLEASVLHFLVPWLWLRIVLLVLTAYSLFYVFGLLAARVARPHLLSEDTLTLRYGNHVVARIPTGEIVGVREVSRYTHTFPAVEDGRMFLAAADGTNLDITLAAPIEAVSPGLTSGTRRRVTTSEFSLFVAEPEALANALNLRSCL